MRSFVYAMVASGVLAVAAAVVAGEWGLALLAGLFTAYNVGVAAFLTVRRRADAAALPGVGASARSRAGGSTPTVAR